MQFEENQTIEIVKHMQTGTESIKLNPCLSKSYTPHSSNRQWIRSTIKINEQEVAVAS